MDIRARYRHPRAVLGAIALSLAPALLAVAACDPLSSVTPDAGTPPPAVVDAGPDRARPPPPDAGPTRDGAIDRDAARDAARDVDASEPDVVAPPLDGGCTPFDAGPDGALRVRIVAANITSGTQSTYEAPGMRILQGLKPDIALIQEMRVLGGNDLRTFVDEAFGQEFWYMVEPQVAGIPNGIVSRYPILESGEWEDIQVSDRDFAYARIDVPGPADLWAVSVHFKTSSATTRLAQASALVAFVRAAVPAGDHVVIGGDFNTGSEGEPALSEIGGVTVVAGPHPADQNGNTRTNASRSKPYDWVFASKALDDREVPVTLGASNYCNGLVFDSRVYSPLSEVEPVQPGDSLATNMQHMPIVRDFLLGP